MRRKARTSEIDAAIAAELRNARVIAGLTQSEIGRRLGVTYQQACKWETGLNRIHVGDFIRWLSHCGVAPGAIAEKLASGHAEQASAARRIVRPAVAELLNSAADAEIEALVIVLRAMRAATNQQTLPQE